MAGASKVNTDKQRSVSSHAINTMIELPNHPNFPEKLAINPLILCDTHFKRLSAVKENVFGAEAQRETIEAYGIAGRVW
jgi:hypothetical protein